MAYEDNIITVSFYIVYLITIWIFLAIIFLKKRKNLFKKKVWLWLYLSYFALAFGDLFHIGFRIFIFFGGIDVNSSFSLTILGLGYLITGITMTYFYICLYHSLTEKFPLLIGKGKNSLTFVIYIIFAIRIYLLLLYYNRWFELDPPNDLGVDFRIISNIPFYIIGIIYIYLSLKGYKKNNQRELDLHELRYNKTLYFNSIVFILSYIFYSLTVFFVLYIPMMGMFMFPKTIMYIVALIIHYYYIFIEEKEEKKI